jgi:hypothetical protein
MHNGEGGFVSDFETVQPTIEEEEAEDDGKERRDGARTDDNSPDSVNGISTFFFVKRIQSTAHSSKILGVLESK